MTSIFVKPVNAVIAGSSFMLSAVTGRSFSAGMPLSISFELTNHCNLGCPECYSGSGMMKRGKGYMDLELFKKVITELKPFLYYINLYFQGEPMLHRQFFSFAEHTGKIFTVVSTNGHYLTSENAELLVRSGISKLIVSLDGMDQSTYSEYRKGGDVSKVIQGIRNIAASRIITGSKMKLEIQFLVNRYNEHQIILADKFARETGADLKLKSMQIITGLEEERWMPKDRKFRRYNIIDGRLSVKSKMPDRCMRLWFNPVITWDGKVVPCCFDKDAEFVMGDLNRESFRSIWNGNSYGLFRQKLLTARKEIKICRNCSSGIKGVRY